MNQSMSTKRSLTSTSGQATLAEEPVRKKQKQEKEKPAGKFGSRDCDVSSYRHSHSHRHSDSHRHRDSHRHHSSRGHLSSHRHRHSHSYHHDDKRHSSQVRSRGVSSSHFKTRTEKYIQEFQKFLKSPYELTKEEAMDFILKLKDVDYDKSLTHEERATVNNIKFITSYVLSYDLSAESQMNVIEHYLAPLEKHTKIRVCLEGICTAGNLTKEPEFFRLCGYLSQYYLTPEESAELNKELRENQDKLAEWVSQKTYDAINTFQSSGSTIPSIKCIIALIRSIRDGSELYVSDKKLHHILIQHRNLFTGILCAWDNKTWNRRQRNVLSNQARFISDCLKGKIIPPDNDELLKRLTYLMFKADQFKNEGLMATAWGLYHEYHKNLGIRDKFDTQLDQMLTNYQKTPTDKLNEQIRKFHQDYPYVTKGVKSKLDSLEMYLHRRRYLESQSKRESRKGKSTSIQTS